MRQLNDVSRTMIQDYEQLRLVAYDDAQPNKVLRSGDKILGTLTIGWGHTGPDVRVGQTITEARAVTLFDLDIGQTLAVIDRAVKVPLTDDRRGALASFAFNVGDEAFLGSTLLRVLNQGHYDQVPRELAKWNKTTVNGKKVTSAGLVKRRATEIVQWALDDTLATNGSQIGEPPSKPIATDAVVTGGVVAGAAAFLSDAAKQIEPLIGYGETIKWIFLGLSLAAIGVVLFTRIRAIRHETS